MVSETRWSSVGRPREHHHPQQKKTTTEMVDDVRRARPRRSSKKKKKKKKKNDDEAPPSIRVAVRYGAPAPSGALPSRPTTLRRTGASFSTSTGSSSSVSMAVSPSLAPPEAARRIEHERPSRRTRRRPRRSRCALVCRMVASVMSAVEVSGGGRSDGSGTPPRRLNSSHLARYFIMSEPLMPRLVRCIIALGFERSSDGRLARRSRTSAGG
mmetsp:Transcript_16426/g.66371  ORF Transcript_16426/g.66371 Transcript_16426/m.66371 type:complete len:212 (-) Transcript_16426:1141-1776(-)